MSAAYPRHLVKLVHYKPAVMNSYNNRFKSVNMTKMPSINCSGGGAGRIGASSSVKRIGGGYLPQRSNQ